MTAPATTSPLPGDDLVPGPTLVATRRIEIDAPPALVWPWVAQVGQERGGFYSYAWLENLIGCRITNADRVHEEWQHPQVGDHVHLHPEVGLDVALVDDGHALALYGATPAYDFSWSFVVVPSETGSTLVLRERYRASGRRAQALVRVVSWVSGPMSRRMLRGIRERVYRSTPSS